MYTHHFRSSFILSNRVMEVLLESPSNRHQIKLTPNQGSMQYNKLRQFLREAVSFLQLKNFYYLKRPSLLRISVIYGLLWHRGLSQCWTYRQIHRQTHYLYPWDIIINNSGGDHCLKRDQSRFKPRSGQKLITTGKPEKESK